jgi:hypothetical protein
MDKGGVNLAFPTALVQPTSPSAVVTTRLFESILFPTNKRAGFRVLFAATSPAQNLTWSYVSCKHTSWRGRKPLTAARCQISTLPYSSSDVKHHDYTIRAAVVRLRNLVEPILTRCIPLCTPPYSTTSTAWHHQQHIQSEASRFCHQYQWTCFAGDKQQGMQK